MRTTNKRFIELARRNTQQPTVRVTLDMTSGDQVLGSADIQSVKVTRSVNGGSYCIGGTEAASMELVVFTSSLPAVPETAAYVVELGYVDDDGTTYWANYGTFATNTENVVRDGLWTTITGYDAFYWMDAEGYNFKTDTSGHKMSSCTMMHYLVSGTSIKWTSSEWSNLGLYLYRPDGTLREQIGQVAAANCANAVITGANTVSLKTPNRTDITLTPNDYAIGGFSTTAETAIAVARVKSTFKRVYDYDASSDYDREEDKEYETSYPINSNGLSIEIESDLFAGGEFTDDTTLGRAQDDLSTIASVGTTNNGLGLSFKGFDATLFGCAFLEPLDIFKVTDHYGETHTVCALSASWEYNGGITTTLSASASAEDSSASSSSNAISKIAAQLDSVQGGTLALQRLTVDTLKGDNATFNTVIADKLTAKDAKITNLIADKADVDLLNVNNAWIENGVIKEGAITSANIHEGAITTAKVSDASITAAKIHDINADSITTGKLKTEYIILTDEDGETQSVISALNAKSQAGEGGVLDGAIVQDSSIEAAKINVADLKAFEATIGSFDIDDVSIHSGKAFIDDPTSGVFVGMTGIGVGDGSYSGFGIDSSKAAYDTDTSMMLATPDYATWAAKNNGTLTISSNYAGFNYKTVSIFGKKGSPFEVYADGSVIIQGKNGHINFYAPTGDLAVNATKLTINSEAVATNNSVSTTLTQKAGEWKLDVKKELVGDDGKGGLVQSQIEVLEDKIKNTVIKMDGVEYQSGTAELTEKGYTVNITGLAKQSDMKTAQDSISTLEQTNASLTSEIKTLSYHNATCTSGAGTSASPYIIKCPDIDNSEVKLVAGFTMKVLFSVAKTDGSYTYISIYGKDDKAIQTGRVVFANGLAAKSSAYNWTAYSIITLSYLPRSATNSTLSWTFDDASTRSQIKQLADSISLSVTDGSLGNTASIKLSANGSTKEETIDLTKVRKSFAKDTSSIELSAGIITVASGSRIDFDTGGTFTLNSAYMTVTSSGTVIARNFTANGAFTGGNMSSGHAMRLGTDGCLHGYLDGIETGRLDPTASVTYNPTGETLRGMQIYGRDTIREVSPHTSILASSNTSDTATRTGTGTVWLAGFTYDPGDEWETHSFKALQMQFINGQCVRSF